MDEPRTLGGGPLADHPFRDGGYTRDPGPGARRRLRRRAPTATLPRAVPLALELRLLFRLETWTGLAIVAIGLLGAAALFGSVAMLYVVLLPVAGLMQTLRGLRRGLRLGRLLSVGLSTRARVIDVRVHGSDGDGPRHATIEFEVDGVTYRREHRLFSSETLEGRATTTVFYDPADPRTNAIAADLPGKPRLDATGALQYERR